MKYITLFLLFAISVLSTSALPTPDPQRMPAGFASFARSPSVQRRPCGKVLARQRAAAAAAQKKKEEEEAAKKTKTATETKDQAAFQMDTQPSPQVKKVIEEDLADAEKALAGLNDGNGNVGSISSASSSNDLEDQLIPNVPIADLNASNEPPKPAESNEGENTETNGESERDATNLVMAE